MTKTYHVLGAMAAIMIVLATVSGAMVQAQTLTDADGDGIEDRIDAYPNDRDNDGITDDRDEYPDDPENREPEFSSLDDRYDDDETDNTDGDGDSLLGGGNLCCMIQTPWFWIIIGTLCLCWGWIENQRGRVYRFYGLVVAGLAAIVYGFSLWGPV